MASWTSGQNLCRDIDRDRSSFVSQSAPVQSAPVQPRSSRLFLFALFVTICFLPLCGCGSDDSTTGNGPAGAATSGPVAGMGIMVGEVTTDTALVQVRLTQTKELADGDVAGMRGVVEFSMRASGDDDSPGSVQLIEATSERDFIARAAFANLKPGQRYICDTRIGPDEEHLAAGPIAEFKTLSGASTAAEVSFVVVTGMNYAKFHGDDRIDRAIHKLHNNTELPEPYAGPDKGLGYPALATILKMNPDFFVGTGDNVYYDTPKEPRAETITEMRQKWHEQFVQPRYRELFAKVPTYWEVDDHDYRIDDCDNTGDYEPSPELALRVLLEQLPYGPSGDDKVTTYRTHRVSRDLQIWLLENRVYRSPNNDPDGPEKTIWGADQKAWLRKTLIESDASFKLVISPNPMLGPDDARKTDNHANIGGFQHERDEFLGWLNARELVNQQIYVICGDRHWQYHSVHPKGLEEFSCGALVDANSRLGRQPGDPASSDPDGQIMQEYSQPVRSGGFLIVRSLPASQGEPARLRFEFFDEQGQTLYEHVKRAR